MKQRMRISYEKGVAIHSAPSFALGTVRCTAKRKQGNRRGGLLSSGMSRKRKRKRKADGFSGG